MPFTSVPNFFGCHREYAYWFSGINKVFQASICKSDFGCHSNVSQILATSIVYLMNLDWNCLNRIFFFKFSVFVEFYKTIKVGDKDGTLNIYFNRRDIITILWHDTKNWIKVASRVFHLKNTQVTAKVIFLGF